MVLIGFLFIALCVVAAIATPLLAMYWLLTKSNHALDEKNRRDLYAVPVPHPEYHKQLRGIDRG